MKRQDTPAVGSMDETDLDEKSEDKKESTDDMVDGEKSKEADSCDKESGSDEVSDE